MKRAMLEVVATKAVTSAQDVQRYIKCTLLAATTDFQVGSPISHLCIAPARANTAPYTETQSAAALGETWHHSRHYLLTSVSADPNVLTVSISNLNYSN